MSLPARAALPLAYLSLLFSGAAFGVYCAGVVPLVTGLGAADPRGAIEVLRVMNVAQGSPVFGPVFGPVFFGTPFVLLFTAGAAMVPDRRAAWLFAVAGVVSLVGGLILTATLDIQIAEAMGARRGATGAEAAALWAEVSPRWLGFNLVRITAGGVTLLLAGCGLRRLGRVRAHHRVDAARDGHSLS